MKTGQEEERGGEEESSDSLSSFFWNKLELASSGGNFL
jgi:hypothetical protein